MSEFSSPPSGKHLLSTVFRYAVGLAIIYWLTRSGTLDFSALTTLPMALIAHCCLLTLIQTILAAYRVHFLLARQDIQISVMRCLVYNCLGLFYSLFLPGGVSGDAVRAFYFMRESEHSRVAVLGALFMDRLMGLVSMATLGLCGVMVLSSTLPMLKPFASGFLILLFLLAASPFVLHFLGSFNRRPDAGQSIAWPVRVWSRAVELISRMHLNRYRPADIASTLMFSLVIHIAAVVMIYLCSDYVQSGLSLIQVAIASPIGLLINAIPLSPGGIGVGEKGFEVLYAAIGGRSGATAFLVSRVFLYLPAVVGGAYGLAHLLARRRHRTNQVAAG